MGYTMKNLHYRDSFSIKMNRYSNWELVTDLEQFWHINWITNYRLAPGSGLITTWWNRQHQDQLRTEQKDVIRTLGSVLDVKSLADITPKGSRTNIHELAISIFDASRLTGNRDELVLVQTDSASWITINSSRDEQYNFTQDNKLGGPWDKDFQIEIWRLRDSLVKKYQNTLPISKETV
jgi:hypothetical protein